MIHRLETESGSWSSHPYAYNSLRLGWTNTVSFRLEHRAVIKGRAKVSLYIDLAQIRIDQGVAVARARLPDEDPPSPSERPIVPEIYDAAGVPMLPWVGVRVEL